MEGFGRGRLGRRDFDPMLTQHDQIDAQVMSAPSHRGITGNR